MRAVAGGSSRQGKGTSSSARQPPRAGGARTPGRAPGPHAAALALHHVPSPRIARAPTKQTPFFDEVETRVRDLTASGGRELAPMRDLLALSKLVHAGTAKDVPAAITTFLASAAGMDAFAFPSTEFSDTLITRVFLLGLHDESRKLREFFIPAEAKRRRPAGFTLDLRIWGKIVDAVLGRAKLGTVAEASATIDDIVVTTGKLRETALALGVKQVGEKLRSEGTGGGGDFTPMAGFFFALRELQRRLFVAAQKAFQVIMDAAISELGTAKATAAIDVADKVLEGKILALVDMTDRVPWPNDTDEWKTQLPRPEVLLPSSEQTVDVTKSTFKGTGAKGEHQDIFGAPKSKHAPVGFTLNDPTQSVGPEKTLSLRRIYEIRRYQVDVLRKMVGTVGTTGKFELHGNDSWRELLNRELIARRNAKASDTEALKHVIQLIEEYLGAFTLMSPNDIEDFGDNYLTRTFPRALTGQLIHDCGVWALRVAYALSLVRDVLKLEFRFVDLPSHLALTVSGPTIEGAWVFNNNNVFLIEKGILKELEKKWAASGKGTTDDFAAHLAAGTYITGVDMPYRVAGVPSDPSGPRLKGKLWDSYQKVTKTPVLGKTKDSTLANFNLRYLEVDEDWKKIRNGFTFLVFARWQEHGPNLVKLAEAANDPKQKDPVAAGKAYTQAADRYQASLEAVRKVRKEAEKQLRETKLKSIDEALKKNPELVAPDAKKAEWRTLDIAPRWEKMLDDYLAQVKARKPEPNFRFQFTTSD